MFLPFHLFLCRWTCKSSYVQKWCLLWTSLTLHRLPQGNHHFYFLLLYVKFFTVINQNPNFFKKLISEFYPSTSFFYNLRVRVHTIMRASFSLACFLFTLHFHILSLFGFCVFWFFYLLCYLCCWFLSYAFPHVLHSVFELCTHSFIMYCPGLIDVENHLSMSRCLPWKKTNVLREWH